MNEPLDVHPGHLVMPLDELASLLYVAGVRGLAIYLVLDEQDGVHVLDVASIG